MKKPSLRKPDEESLWKVADTILDVFAAISRAIEAAFRGISRASRNRKGAGDG
ncbi:hypothetical protein [Microvirga ossetica]|uniref:hypothetical protein n=1 Tax=Microvirga ossetica TaxID=1882682 RepID=UPI0012FFFAF1|nr:hypothetical protein [Microvirga ossetica]